MQESQESVCYGWESISLGPLTMLCYRELHSYRLCLFLLWMLTVFEEILKGIWWVSWHSQTQTPKGTNTHTSWLQLPFPSKCNYAIIFLSDFCFRWEVLKYSHLKQLWRAFYNHPKSQTVKLVQFDDMLRSRRKWCYHK